MGVNVISQGGQNNVTLGQSSVPISDNAKANIQNNLPVLGNEKSMEHMDKGKGQGEFTEKQIKKSVEKLNKFLQGENTHVEYERHDKLKTQFVIRIIDNNTKEVIKEIPPKKILDMVAEMCRLAGVMFDEKA